MSKVEHTRMSSSSSCDESSAKENTTPTTTASPSAAPSGESNAAAASRFSGPGVDFKGKLIGIEEVAEARGDKMCQVAMAKLKAGAKAIGEHKQRITINVSLEGLKIIDEKTTEIIHSHEVSRISFIARDPSDSRAFGYVYRRSDTSHQFFGIKTERAAEGLVLSLRDLFQTVFEIKKKQMEETSNKETNGDVAKTKDEQKENGETKPEKIPKASSDIMDLLDSNADQSLDLKKANPNEGLSPTLQMLDPWGTMTSGNSGIPGMTQQPSGPMSGANLFQPPAATGIGNSLFFPQVVQPVAVVPGATLIGARGPAGNGSGPVFPTAAVIWPTGNLTSGPAPVAAHSGGQLPWGSFGGPMPTSGLSGIGATDPFGSTPAAGFQPQPPAQQQLAGAPVPLIPARRTSPPSNPFAADPFNSAPAGPAGPKKADPFAELDVLGSATAQVQPYGKRVERKDFFQDPVKPSLFDLTQQQQQQQMMAMQQQQQASQQQQSDAVRDMFGSIPFPSTAPVNDPFA